MLIRSIELRNIRSYTQARIDLEEGMTLLSGDIGCGKSTLLLALEFALFGIRRGDLSGEALLRHGEQDGSVTLSFTCGQDVTVCRTLKRTGQGIRQDGGWIEQGGKREPLTANELKARVLEILGYPEELLTKSKGFVFRYTVYTPQEEMKQILTESDEARLDTLRSVFGLDKYRSVVDNASLLGRTLRDRVRYLEGQVSDIEGVRAEKERLAGSLAVHREAFAASEKREAEAKTALDAHELTLEALEEAYRKEQERKRELARAQAERESIAAERERLATERQRIGAALAEPLTTVESPEERRAALDGKRRDVQDKRSEALARLRSLTERKAELDNAAILAMEECPQCLQSVTADHKHHLQAAAERQLAVIAEKEGRLREFIGKADAQLAVIAAQAESLKEAQKDYEAYLRAQQTRLSDSKRLAQIDERTATLVESLRALDARTALPKAAFDEEQYTKQRETVRVARQSYTEAREALASQRSVIASCQEQLKTAEERLTEMLRRRGELVALREREQWLAKAFVPVVGIIERHVLASIHGEFSRRFTEWFGQLIEDDSMYATLSDTFAPLVTQNGYDADLSHLSGGEKTSVALAYRLALNLIVGEFVRSIRTTDLLILDEPTDGFSTEQLDRVRDVLTDLRCRQVLVVSHEQKMEGFVDRVVRVEKRDGQSTIV